VHRAWTTVLLPAILSRIITYKNVSLQELNNITSLRCFCEEHAAVRQRIDAGVKREAGENPARSRHCEAGDLFQDATVREDGKAERSTTPSQETCLKT